MKEIVKQLITIFKNVLDDDDLEINLLTTHQDLEGWDSLAHIRLIVAIEKFYEIHFSAAEISNVEKVGDLADLIIKKQKNSTF